jgi:hypothetical protein
MCVNQNALLLLKLMFDESDTVCVSDSKFAYHSMPLASVLSDKISLVSPNSEVPIKKVSSSDLIFVAINPIKGFRSDLNVYKFKNFMLECDTGTIDSQMEYLKRLGVPYSAVIFSGSKSAHILISLDTPIHDEKSYRSIYQWLLNIGTLFDQACKNPSRAIRIPGAIRPETGKEQTLLEFKGIVAKADLFAYLKLHMESKPAEKEKREISGKHDFSKLKPWVIDRLVKGLDRSKGRNQQWFSIACEFALAGYSEDDTLDILGEFFTPDRDFKEREWKTSVKSGFKYIYDRK